MGLETKYILTLGLENTKLDQCTQELCRAHSKLLISCLDAKKIKMQTFCQPHHIIMWFGTRFHRRNCLLAIGQKKLATVAYTALMIFSTAPNVFNNVANIYQLFGPDLNINTINDIYHLLDFFLQKLV